jgi:hypothetical protein
MTQLLEQAFEKVQSLPPKEQDRIAKKLIDEVENIWQHTAQRPMPRTPGLGKGMVQIADEFTDPLPESFWLGEK